MLARPIAKGLEGYYVNISLIGQEKCILPPFLPLFGSSSYFYVASSYLALYVLLPGSLTFFPLCSLLNLVQGWTGESTFIEWLLGARHCARCFECII